VSSTVSAAGTAAALEGDIVNCVIFHNVHAQTRILHQLAQEGHRIADEVFACLRPYLTAHVHRFGRYT